ncbi:alpha-(1-_3)-arabinofuranosyltransferase domain-containing protein, partial [Ilumatobacter sp.]|uniref:alpha-(1->3)-arabinofuranosyltransferase domain-containing protein n=1 Tax=Ilumatobacter sp. TaxID=1967498 RepID=UPI003C3468AA
MIDRATASEDPAGPADPQPVDALGTDANDPVWRRRLWPVGVVYSVLATAATMASSWGRYVSDNRYEQYANPARRIARWFGSWDGTRGLGAPREDLWPATTLPGAVLRSLGAPTWVAERGLHVVCLVTAALGAVALMRWVRPRIGVEHFLAGLFCAFGPHSATFLVPSNLYFLFAIGPWLAVIALRGITSARPWRWAAIFALVVGVIGNPDLPGLMFHGLIVGAAVAYLIVVERSATLRHSVAWCGAAAALSIGVSTWMLVKTSTAAASFGSRLADTELATTYAQTSSWSESIRGLGNWLSYVSIQGQLLEPQGSDYFTNGLIIAATFALPIVAMGALAYLDERRRLVFAIFVVVSLATVVGAFSGSSPTSIGRAFQWALDNVQAVTAFRNTHKSASGLTVGISALAALGIVAFITRLHRSSPIIRALPIIGTATVVLAVSFPFWTGSLYHPANDFDEVPDYWDQAFEFLDSQPEGGRTTFLPAASRVEYQWGSVGDDIVDASLARPHAIATGVALSTPVGADALETFVATAQSRPYRPGILGDLARRLGITEIVIRNDLKWRTTDLPRPASYASLREDPDFERVAGFGLPGENVGSELDRTLTDSVSMAERELQPVEVFRLRSPTSMLHVTPSESPLVVDGDTDTWVTLARLGELDDAGPIVTAGATSDEDLARAVAVADGVVLSDSARLRLRTLLGFEPQYSASLGPDQQVGRPVRSNHPGVEGADAVLWYPDASDISSSVNATAVLSPSHRVGYAFDDDPGTAWTYPSILGGFRPTARVELRESTAISDIHIEAFTDTEGKSTVRAVLVRLSDGTEFPVLFDEDGLGAASV